MKYNAVTVTQLNKYLKDKFDEDENLGAIIGVIIAILILCTRLYELIIAIVLIILGAFVGNYVQRNKDEVKIKLKNFIDRL